MKKGFLIVPILLGYVFFIIVCGWYISFPVCNYPRPVAAKSQIKSFETALTNFFLDCGRFPSTEEGLVSLVLLPKDRLLAAKWLGPYLTGKLPLDPWGNPYRYRKPATPPRIECYEIISLGADGKEGGKNNDADIISWAIE